MPNAPTITGAADVSETRSEWGTLAPEAVVALEREYALQEATPINGVRLFVDNRKDISVPAGVQRVYPFVDEGEDLLETARAVMRAEGGTAKFDRVVDSFAGGGNSMLPILQAGIAERGFGIDLNPRAIELAGNNAKLNNLQDRATFVEGDVNQLDQVVLSSDGSTLFIANPPFALTTQEKERAKSDLRAPPSYAAANDALPGNDADSDLMRKGGLDGLKWTRVYIDKAMTIASTQRALESAKPGDVVIGMAYSRMRPDGTLELNDELNKATAGRGTHDITIMSNRTLWREPGPNGQKRQPNPMPMTSMNIKGTNAEERAEYDRAAASHMAEGFDRIAYVSYVIRVGAAEAGREDTRTETAELLA